MKVDKRCNKKRVKWNQKYDTLDYQKEMISLAEENGFIY